MGERIQPIQDGEAVYCRNKMKGRAEIRASYAKIVQSRH